MLGFKGCFCCCCCCCGDDDEAAPAAEEEEELVVEVECVPTGRFLRGLADAVVVVVVTTVVVVVIEGCCAVGAKVGTDLEKVVTLTLE